MVINTKFSIGEQVLFKYGPNEIETPGVVVRISVVVGQSGRVNVKYWVVYEGCCCNWIQEKRLYK